MLTELYRTRMPGTWFKWAPCEAQMMKSSGRSSCSAWWPMSAAEASTAVEAAATEPILCMELCRLPAPVVST